MEAFVQRFENLKNRAKISDEHVIAMVFHDSFSPEEVRLIRAATKYYLPIVNATDVI